MLAIDAHERRERADFWRAGLITSAIVNSNRKKGSRSVSPEDFVPNRQIKKPQTAVQMAGILQAATIAMGGTVSSGDRR